LVIGGKEWLGKVDAVVDDKMLSPGNSYPAIGA
jgi:hypothetical protein